MVSPFSFGIVMCLGETVDKDKNASNRCVKKQDEVKSNKFRVNNMARERSE